MATPRKVGKRWRIEKQVNGRKLSSYHDSKQSAINWMIEQEAVHSKKGYIKGRTMAMLFDRYEREVVAGRKGERWDKMRLKRFTERFGSIAVESFDEFDIERWRDERLKKIQASSFNRDLNLLSAALTKAVKWRWRTDNPVANVDRPKDPPPRDRIISDPERDLLLAELGVDIDNIVISDRKHELGVIFLIALATALRLGEITSLRWEHVHLGRQYVHIPDSKNGTKRDVPLSRRAVYFFESIGPKDSGAVFTISRDVASNYFRDARRAVELHDIVFHDTRHTAVTELAKHLSPLELARAVGHKKLDMTLRYFNAHASDLADKLG